MTTPELSAHTAPLELQTNIPGVSMHELSAAELSGIRDLISKNYEFFRKGGLDPEYELNQKETDLTADQPSSRRHTGIWVDDKLIGFVSVESECDTTNPLDVEISYAVDQDYARNGIAEAAVSVITAGENDIGHNVIAEVEGRNVASKRMLGKIGYEEARHTSNGREVFISQSMSDEALLRRLYF